MAYDIWGSWSPLVGPNAPLNDSCAAASAQEGSAVSAVDAWTAANFPADQVRFAMLAGSVSQLNALSKIALGVAAYGHSYHVASSAALRSAGSLAAYPPFVSALQPHGDSEDGDAGVDQCGNPVGVGGIFNFWGLIDAGFLTSNGTAASGIDYRFDQCSQT